MKQIIITGILLGAIALSGCQSPNTDGAVKPEDDRKNRHLLMATAWFQMSAEMQACYYQAYNMAEMALKAKLASDTSEKPNAVVLDIDETLLDNSPFEVEMIRQNREYSSEFWAEWISKAEAKALPGAVAFCRFADSLGLEIFYLSNRKQDSIERSMINMLSQGFPQVADNHFLLKDTSSDKTYRRNSIRKDYDILLFVGDNLGDFNEFFAERDSLLGFDKVAAHKEEFGTKYIILPNPMYGGWASHLRNRSDASGTEAFLRELIIDMQGF